MKKQAFLASLAAAVLLPAEVGLAHHSFAMFDTSKRMLVECEVVDWAFNNPHCWLFINVDGAGGEIEKWGFEGAAPVSLIGRGVTGTTFEPGDRVRVVMCPLRDGRKGGHLAVVETEDGSTYTPNDAGCAGP